MSVKKYIFNFFIFIFILIIFLPVILFFSLQIKSVQQSVNKKITYFIEDNLNTTVSIDQVSYHAPFDIVISKFFVSDFEDDTLFYAQKLKFRPLSFNTKKNLLKIDKIILEGFRAKYKVDSTGFSNLDYFLLNLTQSNDTISSSSTSMNIKIRKIDIKRSSFFFTSEELDSLPYNFDVDTIDFFRFGAEISNFSMLNDDINFKLKKFNAYEKSGFRIKGISANVFINEDSLNVSQMVLRLNRSRFFLDDFSSFVDSLTNIEHYQLSLKNQSFVVLSDLGFFSNYFENYNERAHLGVKLNGTLDNLYMSKFLFRYNQDTYVDLSGHFVGLTVPEKMFFDIDIKEIRTSKYELGSLKNPIDNKPLVEFPESVQLPNKISFSGTAQGLTENFNVQGNVVSTSGNASFDLNVLYDSISVGLGGKFELLNFDLAYTLKNNLLGTVTLVDSLDIVYFDLKKIKGFNNSEISHFDFKNYRYNNIDFKADFNYSKIKGELNIADSNLQANIDIAAKIIDDKIIAQYSFNVDTARLFPLNIVGDDKLAAFSVGIKGNLAGKDINDLEGKLYLSSPLILIKNLQKLKINKFEVESENLAQINDNFYRLINVNSDFIDGSLSGTFDVEKLNVFFNNFMVYYFPSLGLDTVQDLFNTRDKIGNNLKIDLTFNNLKSILDIFAPTIFIADNSKLTGSFSDSNEELVFDFLSDSIIFSENKILNLIVQIKSNNNDFNFSIYSDSIGASKFNMQKFSLISQAKNDNGNMQLKWNNDSKKKNSGVISSQLSMTSDSTGKWHLNIIIPKDTVYINDILWTMSSKKILLDSSGIDIRNLTFSTSYMGQNIGVKGKISENPQDSLFLYISRFDISQLNPILDNVKLNGFLLTEIVASKILAEPDVYITSNIDRFTVNDVQLGFVEQDLELNSTSGLLKTNLSLQKYGKVQKIIDGKNVNVDTLYRSLNLLAKYSLNDKIYDANLIIDNFKLKAFAPYLKDYMVFSRNSNVNGNLFIKGNDILYDIQGFVNLYGSFLLFPTGVNYTINGGLRLNLYHNLIKLEKTVIVGPDLIGDASMWGTVKHNQFKDPYLDLNIKADTILVLNLPRTSSGKYYGKVVATGNIEIKGRPEDVAVTADIEAEPETKLTMLMDRPDEITNKTDIVTFINPYDTTVVIDEIAKQEINTNIDLDLNLSLNPDAKFKLIFNEMTGEALEIQGEGDIKVKKTALGDVVIFGKIAIVDGSYKFILENIVNRRFVINKGSSITFNGAPTDGIIDITTLYTIKNVSLSNLMVDDLYLDQKTQADCYIYLKGPILKPEIKFDVDLPNADDKIATQVTNLDDANKNKQFLSLLLIGRFQPFPWLTSDLNSNMLSGTFNAGELLSNQLNSFLTNLGTNVDLDVNYKTGDQSTTDQFDVALSVPLLNERISINTDLGVGGTNENIQEKNNFIGDFEVDVKLNKKGNLQLKGYNKTNRNELYQQGYTQGIGLLYKSDLDNIFKRDTSKTKKNGNK